MTKWTLSDGTVVTHGLRINGTSPVAQRMRELARESRSVEVRYLPHPCEGLPLDPSDDWVVHHFLEDIAVSERLKLVTDYKATFDRAPRRAQEAIRDWEAQAQEDPPDAIY